MVHSPSLIHISYGVWTLASFLVNWFFLHLLSDWKIKEICFNSIVGPGLSFAAFPEGIQAQMPAATNWAVMFFFMLFTIGLGSQIRQILASLIYKRSQSWRPNVEVRRWYYHLSNHTPWLPGWRTTRCYCGGHLVPIPADATQRWQVQRVNYWL